jgi:hypothetical protein
MIRQLTSKSLSSTDIIPVISNTGIPYQVSGSEFSSNSLVFAHVSFDGSAGNSFDGSTIAGHNIKSVTRTGEGIFKVEFTASHSNGNYTAIGSAGKGNHTSSARAVSIDETNKDYVVLRVERTDTGSQQDEEYIAIMILG